MLTYEMLTLFWRIVMGMLTMHMLLDRYAVLSLYVRMEWLVPLFKMNNGCINILRVYSLERLKTNTNLETESTLFVFLMILYPRLSIILSGFSFITHLHVIRCWSNYRMALVFSFDLLVADLSTILIPQGFSIVSTQRTSEFYYFLPSNRSFW